MNPENSERWEVLGASSKGWRDGQEGGVPVLDTKGCPEAGGDKDIVQLGNAHTPEDPHPLWFSMVAPGHDPSSSSQKGCPWGQGRDVPEVTAMSLRSQLGCPCGP